MGHGNYFTSSLLEDNNQRYFVIVLKYSCPSMSMCISLLFLDRSTPFGWFCSDWKLLNRTSQTNRKILTYILAYDYNHMLVRKEINFYWYGCFSEIINNRIVINALSLSRGTCLIFIQGSYWYLGRRLWQFGNIFDWRWTTFICLI
jgi:hypothetical protein